MLYLLSIIHLSFIQKNQLYGRDGKPPLTYKGCMEVATKVLAANKIAHTMIYTTGDPYVGPSTDALKKKTERVVELEKENKSLRDRIRELEARYGMIRTRVVLFILFWASRV